MPVKKYILPNVCLCSMKFEKCSSLCSLCNFSPCQTAIHNTLIRFVYVSITKSQRKFIGAKVIDGNYTLIDPTETVQDDVDDDGDRRQSSGSMTGEREIIRLPPSLTLSKIRSVKQHALVACIRSKIEISTLALACIYFERLCLDCRVDKSNRRLSFAACLLLAAKVNESNSMIVYDRGDGGVEPESKQSSVLNSWVKPNKKSNKIFESLVVFFTHDWSLSMKQLYAAEWIVFTVSIRFVVLLVMPALL